MGIGANMQCMSYMPGHYSNGDLNLDVKCGTCVPGNYTGENLRREHCYNDMSTSLAPDQSIQFDKELLRQTILKHDSIFKDQIRELHRLYRRQRELMDENRRKELYNSSFQLKPSHSYSFPPQSSSSQKIWQSTGIPLKNSAYTRASPANIQEPLFLKKEKGCCQSGKNSILNNCDVLQFEANSNGKKMLDLQLSADEYIDIEKGKPGEQFFEVINVPDCPIKSSEAYLDNNVKSCPRNVVSNSGFYFSSCGSVVVGTNSLTDLNVTAQPEEAEGLNTIGFLDPVTSSNKILCGNLLENANSRSQFNSCFEDIQARRDAELLNVNKEKKIKWPPCAGEAGRSGSTRNHFFQGYHPKDPHPSKSLEAGIKSEVPRTQLQWNRSGEKVFGLEVPEISYDPSSCNSSWPSAALDMSSSHQPVPHADAANLRSSSISPWKEPVDDLKRVPIAVQALPSFNSLTPPSKRPKSSAQSSTGIGEKFNAIRNSRCNPGFGSAGSSQIIPQHGFQANLKTAGGFLPTIALDYMDCNDNSSSSSAQYESHKKYSKDLKFLGVRTELNMNPNSILLGSVPQQQATKQETEIEDTLEQLPWLRAKPEKKSNLDMKKEYTVSRDSAFSDSFPTHNCDIINPKEEQSQHRNKMILGFPVQISSNSSSKSEDMNSIKVGEIDINVACVSTTDSSDQLISLDQIVENEVEKRHFSSGACIDLNSCLKEDEVLCETEIDMEAPVSPENKEQAPPRGESEENQVETPLQQPEQEDGDNLEELVKVAAAVLVSIPASGVQTRSESTTCQPSEASSFDSLHWFASVVSSAVGDLSNEFETISCDKSIMTKRSTLSPEIDYFEAMTLSLTEMKVEEYCCKTNSEEEVEGATTDLPTRPRKGRMTLGRQRKDFQREILPCLASLSRHEVTEDLQTIGGLMEASGTATRACSMRSSGRNGGQKGRRRTRVSPLDAIGTAVCLPPKKPTGHVLLPLEEMSLVGWGKITRRRRGPRCPATNPPLILSQV